MTQELGKIKRVSFGAGGYQDAMIGISFSLGGKSWGTGDFWGYWATNITSSTQWTAEDREKALGKMVMRVDKLMQDARVKTIDQLEGVPIRCTFDGGALVSWEILKEVL